MLSSDSTLVTLAVSIAMAAGIIFSVDQLSASDDSFASETVRLLSSEAETSRDPSGAAAKRDNQPITVAQAETASGTTTDGPANSASTATQPTAERWSATAAGRVEPQQGVIDLSPEVQGIVVEKFVDVGDAVKAGDIIYRLKDDEILARWRAALNEIDVRKRERAEDPTVDEDKKKADKAKPRQEAEDAVADAHLARYDARRAFEIAYAKLKSGSGTTEAVESARKAVTDAEAKLVDEEAKLKAEQAKDDVPLPTRLDGSLQSARDQLRLIEIALERTRLRAPSDGTIMAMTAEVGEVAVPSPLRPLVKLGDLNELAVRSELEERDIGNIGVGQDVIVRSSAYTGRDFKGKVKWVAPSLAPPKLSGRGPRSLADVDVIELTIDLEGNPPLLPGMRVDVFFKPLTKKEAAVRQ
ncbi:MAG: efflux RND transporter periplasmic adaptor subunit [Pseudomonadota bacterium]